MATIRKRNGSYHVQVRKRGYTPVTNSFKDRATALAWAKKVESEIDRYIYLDIGQTIYLFNGRRIFVAGFSFVDRTKGQYTNCESRHILKFYRVWVNTIPSGNKPVEH